MIGNQGRVDLRRVAVSLAGFMAFVNLYAPQSVLPLMSQEFAVGAVQISTALTAAVLIAMAGIVWPAWGEPPVAGNH